MKHITVAQALSTAVKIHNTGEKWNYSIEKAFIIRKLFNAAFDEGYTKEEILRLIFTDKTNDPLHRT